MSDDLEIKDKIINDALKNINFDGWTKETILTSFVSNKINVDDYDTLFPNGIIDTIIHFADLSKVEEFIERRLKNVKLLGSITKPIKENLNKPFNILNNFPFFNFNR